LRFLELINSGNRNVPKRLIAKKTDKVLTPVRPNVGIEVAYGKKLQALIAEMDNSVVYWLRTAYRANEPMMAQDRTPADELRDAIRKLAKRWQKNFDEAAPALAEYFAQSVSSRSSGALKAILKKAGFTVEFKMTRAMRDIMSATVSQQVSLIKSIPSRYFTNIEGQVMRSVQTGRDLGQLTKDLQEQFGVTHRRAAFIARDQNNKATASMTRARQDELGISEAIWVHSGAGKHPRPTHVAMNGKKYDVNKGMWDSAVNRWIFPGEEINCRCISRSIIPGFS
jgi:SPP1 gp7 family putative phage head morphogenesis protein